MLGEPVEGDLGLVEGQPDPLGGADEGDPAQCAAGVPALVAGGAGGVDQAQSLVVAQCGGGEAAPLGELADREQVVAARPVGDHG